MNPKISIIIPMRTITPFLLEAISHLKNLDYSNFEVLFFSDEKETFLGLPKHFKFIKSGNVGPADKRNLALKHARGEILAFLDDDAFPKVDWLKKAVLNFTDKSICAVGGPSITPFRVSILEEASGMVLSSPLTSGGTSLRHKPGARQFVDDYPTVNLFVRFSDFKKIRGFKSEFWPGEDTKLCLDLIKITNKKILYDPKVCVYHHRRELFLPHLKQVSRYGTHRGQFARIFPETSRKLSYFMPSFFVLGLLGGLILSFYKPIFTLIYLTILLSYLMLLFIESIKVFLRKESIVLTIYFAFGVFLTHLVYGSYFLSGLFVRPKLNLRAIDKKSRRFLEG